MITLESKGTQIDELLDMMAEDIQLDNSRYDRMKASYKAVQEWIESDTKFFLPFKYDVYSHGSVRIGTTVKPIKGDEFDLDVVIHLQKAYPNHTPDQIYKELKRRLEESDKYKSILEPKNRCLRLNYSGDYHMDILPGLQENEFEQNKIMVPDRELGTWVSSNPKGYSEWFLAKANLVNQSILEKALRAENLPSDEFKYKKPLQRAVQLIKRYRDLYFQNDDSYKTSSIILTTIAGHFYSGEDSIFDTIDSIVLRVLQYTNSTQSRLKIVNPVNANENFTDKWDTDRKYYTAFIEFVQHLNNEWTKLKSESGLFSENVVLSGLFGNGLVNGAQLKQSNLIGGLRGSKDLGINKGTGLLTSTRLVPNPTIKPNTFYGS